MDILIGMLLGIALVFGSAYILTHLKSKKTYKSLHPPTEYDTRIDDISSSGLVRYRIHKAMKDPNLRKALEGKDYYKKASSLLGWNS